MPRWRRSWWTRGRARWTSCSTRPRARGWRRSASSSCMRARPDARGCRRAPPARHGGDRRRADRPRRGALARAPRLRAVVNVEGNFLRNVDYDVLARGIHLVASGAFAPAVAEAALAWRSTCLAGSPPPTARCARASRPTSWRATAALSARGRGRGHRRPRGPRALARAPARALPLPGARLRPVAA